MPEKKLTKAGDRCKLQCGCRAGKGKGLCGHQVEGLKKEREALDAEWIRKYEKTKVAGDAIVNGTQQNILSENFIEMLFERVLDDVISFTILNQTFECGCLLRDGRCRHETERIVQDREDEKLERKRRQDAAAGHGHVAGGDKLGTSLGDQRRLECGCFVGKGLCGHERGVNPTVLWDVVQSLQASGVLLEPPGKRGFAFEAAPAPSKPPPINDEEHQAESRDREQHQDSLQKYKKDHDEEEAKAKKECDDVARSKTYIGKMLIFDWRGRISSGVVHRYDKERGQYVVSFSRIAEKLDYDDDDSYDKHSKVEGSKARLGRKENGDTKSVRVWAVHLGKYLSEPAGRIWEYPFEVAD